jgi:hypothetical protein
MLNYIVETVFFRCKYDAKVWAAVTAVQIRLAEPRRIGDEMSFISSEVFFEARCVRQIVGFRRWKNTYPKIPPQYCT